MKDRRKKLIIIMSAVLAVLIVIGIVIGVTQAKKQKELEEQGVFYQDGAEGVEIWDDEEFIDESEAMDSDDGEGLEVIDGDTESEDGNNFGNSSTGSKDNKASGNKNNNSTSNNDNNGNTSSADKNSSNKGNSSSNNNTSGNSGSGNTGNVGNSNSSSSSNKPSIIPTTGKSTYEQYIAMTPAQQQKYFESFDSENDFFTWYRKAKAEYDKKNDKNEISGGSIDIGDYMD